jgi:uncharacterized repeat protein (TIGR01451 family)
MEARLVLASLTVVSTADDGSSGTLRWAILQVNSDTVPGTIQFDVPGAGVQVLGVSSPLPALTRQVVIDGTTQPGYDGQPLIQIDGSTAGQGALGLVLTAGSSVVRGLAITRFSGAGLVLNGGSGSLVQGNVLGADPAGSRALPNGDGIQVLGSSSNTIGGSTTAAANVISGNLGEGIRLASAGQDATANLIEGNLIGTAADGRHALGNGQSGILMSGVTANQIGGADAGTRNVIAANLQHGLDLTASSFGNLILGNLIGIAADGTSPLGNRLDGVHLSGSPNNTIGGLVPGSANVISANFGNGIETTWGAGANLIQGNLIGTDANGTLSLGNHGNGVILGSSSNSVGGLSSGAGNVIAYNGTGLLGAGVQLYGLVTQNEILSNSIHDNAGLGINLGNGPTPNHAPGQAQGPNNYQNYPILSAAQTDGRATSLTGTLLGAANSGYTIQYFWSPTGDPSGYGEGRYLMGSYAATTDAAGNASMAVNLSTVPPNSIISATATDAAGNSSEFSPYVTVRGSTDLVVGIVATPDPVGVGASLTYTVTVANKGFLDAHDVVLSDVLPGLVTIASTASSQGPAPTVSGQTVTASIGTLPAQASARLTIVVQVQGGVGSSLVSTASATEDEIDPTPQDDSASVTTRVTAAADLGLRFDDSASIVHLGDPLTWTLTASNRGPSLADHVRLSVPLTGLAFTAATSTQGQVDVQGGQLVADLGGLASGSQATVTVQLQAASVGTITSTAILSSDEYDPAPGDNAASVTLTVLPVTNLGLTIATDRAKAASGQTVQLTIKATNHGADATGVTLTDIVPAGLAFLSASSDLGTAPAFDAQTGTLTAEIGDLASGEVCIVTVKALVTAAPSVTLIDTASIVSNEFDTDPSDNAAACSILVRPVSGLEVTITPDAASVPVGQKLGYDLTVANKGPADEPDAVLALPLPSGVTLVSAASDLGPAPVFQGGVLMADLGALADRAMARVSIVISPGVAALGELTLTASAQGQNVDPDPSSALASTTVTVTPTCGLAVSLTPQTGPAHQGADLTYLLTVVNGGPLDAANVKVASPLPPGVTFVSADSDGAGSPAFAGGQVTAALGTLAVGQSVHVRITVNPAISAPAPGGVRLEATASSDTFDPDLNDNSASAIVAVAPSDDLAVSLLTSPASRSVTLGDPFTLTAIVINRGPSAATGVLLRLPLGASSQFLSATSDAGQASIDSGVLVVPIGSLGVGSQVTARVVLSAASDGIGTWTASVSGTEYDLNPGNNQATAAMTILEPPGILSLAAPAFSVSESAGYLDVPIVRSLGSQGPVSVHFQTVGGDATPGVDYVPVSGILSFADGESSKLIRIPILANPHDNHDEFLGLALDSPTGGASLGSQASAVIRIVDIDPDVTPPQVAALHWAESSASWIVATFSEPVQTATALVAADYQFADLGTSGQARVPNLAPIALSVAGYDPTSQSVALLPARPLLPGHFYRITVVGAGPAPIRDLAGNPLAGMSGAAGTDYVGLFGSGASLKYLDRNSNVVTVRVSGPGYFDLIRDATGQGQVLRLQGGIPGATTISGSVARPKGRGIATTTLDTIEGLGQFGDIRVRLTNPPFFIRNYPFFLNTGRPIRGGSRAALTPRPAPRPAARPVRPVPQTLPRHR